MLRALPSLTENPLGTWRALAGLQRKIGPSLTTIMSSGQPANHGIQIPVHRLLSTFCNVQRVPNPFLNRPTSL
ncbi:predicted protein [Chaetomium globosum CBS 148.51]|uniref:Uncharacterized protein n=1 Tax=Chaetomium globosum (strain ATCC 6205 / CBS 148.51 / DSM 1962 / NBRC 6347 / NRRL 1970) TaxID=306901 RepID=Q2GWM9_CHAGB|nr:uncharacterized protein CHGG_07625 [Chaetomium globosum CBS 148.51]EAQ86372.1 predicted protein [Chaetomium globosum CBS 148.51]